MFCNGWTVHAKARFTDENVTRNFSPRACETAVEWTWIQSRYNSEAYTPRDIRRRNSAAKLSPSSVRFAADSVCCDAGREICALPSGTSVYTNEIYLFSWTKLQEIWLV